MDLARAIEQVVADTNFGVASARKRGNDPRFPYVPVIEHGERTANPIRGRAYATREEAVSSAERAIERRRQALAEQLAAPRYRALREAYGLPRELPQDQ
jgi:hypothetical protein